MTRHDVILGDSRSLNKLKDKSVHLIITSPPYWQLKDYGNNNQIGFNDSYEQYINNLNVVWSECYRVLADGCRMCINIGDQFARSVYYGRYKVIPIRAQIIRFCETLGMDYMGAIIWQKNTTMNTTGGGAVMGSFPYPRNGILKIDYEFILIFKKLGKSPKPTKEQKEMSILSKEEWNTYFASHWHFNGVKQLEHIAMFPEELPKRLIKMFSFVGETVFDPFLGSGTTSLAALHLGRNSIGYEINADFLPVINEKLCKDTLIKDNDSTVIFSKDDVCKYSYDSLPYVFHDISNINKKLDVKKLQFGSKIDKTPSKRNDLFSVSDVLSPNTIVLNNGLVVCLLGVSVKEDTYFQAVDFLKAKFYKHKVFLKYDDVKYTVNNNPLCYIYLDNKTFINRHLIKTKYVNVDASINYRYKKEFLEDIKNG